MQYKDYVSNGGDLSTMGETDQAIFGRFEARVRQAERESAERSWQPQVIELQRQKEALKDQLAEAQGNKTSLEALRKYIDGGDPSDELQFGDQQLVSNFGTQRFQEGVNYQNQQLSADLQEKERNIGNLRSLNGDLLSQVNSLRSELKETEEKLEAANLELSTSREELKRKPVGKNAWRKALKENKQLKKQVDDLQNEVDQLKLGAAI